MSAELIKESVLNTMVDAGRMFLEQYKFISPELEEKHQGLMALDKADDTEKDALFWMNQTGNMFYVSTSPELTIRTKKLFASVAMLFAAMTSAMDQAGKSLFDYEAWLSLVDKSGFFVEVEKTSSMLLIKKSDVAVNIQIIQQLIPGLSTDSAMAIAKGVLSTIHGELQATERDEEAKVGHLLFICEELYGVPSITIRLFYASQKSHRAVIQAPCHTSATSTFEQLQNAHTFLFASPDTISEYANLFTDQPEEYRNLIEHLKELITAKD